MTKRREENPFLSPAERKLTLDAHKKWLERSSTTYLECAISLMLTHMTFAEVIEILRWQVQQLKDTPGSGIDEDGETSG